MELAQILREGMNRGASDFHLKPKQHAVLRDQGKLMPIDSWPPIETKDLDQMAQAMMTSAQRAMEPRGLVLVTGPAGSGKTTTLAAMIHHMNQLRNDHIVTIEDPIEY